MPLYDEDAFPFTVEDWTEDGAHEILACCRDVLMANAAWAAEMKYKPNRKIVARWGRAHTTRRWDVDDPDAP